MATKCSIIGVLGEQALLLPHKLTDAALCGLSPTVATRVSNDNSPCGFWTTSDSFRRWNHIDRTATMVGQLLGPRTDQLASGTLTWGGVVTVLLFVVLALPATRSRPQSSAVLAIEKGTNCRSASRSRLLRTQCSVNVTPLG